MRSFILHSWLYVALLLLLLGLPSVVQAQFTFTTNNGTITIMKYTGTGGDVTIPDTTNGWPVTSIGVQAFYLCRGVTSVMIPSNVTSIGYQAFGGCFNLTAITVDTNNPAYSSSDGVLFDKTQTTLIQYPMVKAGASCTIPNTVTIIGTNAFDGCTNLTSETIPDSVTSIAYGAFGGCRSLTTVTIGNGVTNFGSYTFADCSSLTNVTIGKISLMGLSMFQHCTKLVAAYFKGNAPASDLSTFYLDNLVTAYYLPGTTGWSGFSSDTGVPAVLWNPQVQTSGSGFGVGTNGLGFTITGTANIPIAIEACTTLATAVWLPLESCTVTNGSIYFSDPQWTNYPGRFYRLRSP
jgi:hypothetical protein